MNLSITRSSGRTNLYLMPQPSAFPQVEYLQGTEITRVKAISLTDPL